MTTNTMTNEDPMTNASNDTYSNTTNTNTANAVRVTRAVIGFGLMIPVVAGAVSPALVFGLSMAGSCLIFTSIVSKNSVFGCISALAIMSFIALTSASIAPATVAIMSLASIAIVAAGLIGFQLPEAEARKNSPEMALVNAHIRKVSNVGNAVNDDRRNAA